MRKKINIYWRMKSNIISFFSKRWRVLIILLCIFFIADFYWTTGLVEKKEIAININSSFLKNAHLNIICTINNSLSEFNSDPEFIPLGYNKVHERISDWIEIEYSGILPDTANIPDTIDLGDYYYFKYRHYDCSIHGRDSSFFVSEYYNKSFFDPIICIDVKSKDLKNHYWLNPLFTRVDSLLIFHEAAKIDKYTYAYLNKKNQHHMLVKGMKNESSFKYFAKPINETQKDSIIHINVAYEGNFFQKEIKRLTKYIYTHIKVKFDNVPEKYYRDTRMEYYSDDIYPDSIYIYSNLRDMKLVIKHQNLPLPGLNITPEPDIITGTYIEYNSYEKCKQILKSGIIIYAENLHYKSFINNLDFILATILGALISILVDIIVRKIYIKRHYRH